jgi:hypothetical protein
MLLSISLGIGQRQPVSPGPLPTYADALPGSDIGAKTNAAFSHCRELPGACIVKLQPSKVYTFSTTIRIPETSATLDCGGSTLQYQGRSDAILVSPGPAGPPFISGGIQDCTIVGNSAAHANGIHQQSRVGFVYDRVAIRDFNGADSAAIWWENVAGNQRAPGWNEQDVVRKMDLGNSTTLFRLTRSTGTDSFAYNRFEDLHLDVMDGQAGLSIEGNGTPGSVSLIHSDIALKANVHSSAQSARVIAVTRGGRIEGSKLTVLAEQTSGAENSYGIYVDDSSSVYTSGVYSVAQLKTFGGADGDRLVMIPTLNPTTGGVHYEPARDVIQQRHCKFDLGPRGAAFWLASYGGVEVNCDFQIAARNTDDANPNVDHAGQGSVPVNLFYADGKTKSIGVGPGFSGTAPPAATLSVSGTAQLGSKGTAISKLAKYEQKLSPAPVPAGTCSSQIFPIAGIEAGDIVIAVNKSQAQADLAIGGFSAPSAGMLLVNFCNVSARPIEPTPDEAYSVVVVR